jgi:4-hydroxybenzoate polyprenyltransferase
MTFLQKCEDSGLLLGGVGVSLVLFVSRSVGQWPPFLLIVASLLLCIVSYVVDRVVDGKPVPRGTSIAAVLLVGLFLYELWQGRWLVCLIYLASPLTVFLYSWPILGRVSTRYQCIKNIPLMKSFYVPICWTLSVAVSAAYLENFPAVAVLPTFLIIFERIFQGGVACDFKDIEADRAAGVVTIPVRLGLNATVWLLHGIAVVSFLFLMVSVKAGWINPRMWILGVQYIGFAVLLERMRRPGIDLYHYGAVVDVGYLVLIPLALLLG